MTGAAPADDRTSPEVAAAITAVFAERGEVARGYADLLNTDGVLRGVIGPREAGRLWSRHLLNSTALASLLPTGARVVDLGSGAGLPGIPLAIARPDLDVVLLEPLARRVAFLDDCRTRLAIPNVTIHHGRAQDGLEPPGEYVVARAVAPLDKLISLCRRILINNGVLLALKGTAALGEVDQVRRTMKIDAEVLTVEAPGQHATVVSVRLAAPPRPGSGR